MPFSNDDKFINYRSKLLNETIGLLALTSSINLIFTIHLATKIGWQPYATLQTFAVTLFITMWLIRNKLSYNVKAFGLMSCAYIITFATLINLGPMAHSKAGVIVMLLIAAVFLDWPFVILVFVAITLGFAIVSYLAIYKLITFRIINYESQAHHIETWANMAIVLIVSGSLVAWIARSMINELIVSRKAAEAANHAKSQFLANVSHELRTPLNAILGFTNILLEQRPSLTPTQYEQLEIIAHSGNSLHRLIDDVLDLVRAEAGHFKLKMQAVSLPTLFKEIINIVQPHSERKGLILRFDIETFPPQQLIIDKERLRQIVLNLLDNAIKFTAQGEVSLTVNYLFLDKSRLKLIISVTDTGPGIALSDQERIFLPFEQVHRDKNIDTSGLGLGLAVCRQLAQLMNGELTVQSIVGSGSCFILKLPATMVLMPSFHCTVLPQLINYRFHSNMVVIVDDVQENRALLRVWLSNVGLSCIETTNGIEAIACIKQLRPALVLLDIKMSGLNGFQVASQLKSDPVTTNIPLIAVTAAFNELDNREQNKELFAAWLIKPLVHNELLACLSNFLAHEQIVNKQSELKSVASKLTINDLPLQSDLKMLRELAEFRMISEMQDWSNVNADSYPQFVQRLNELVRSCDLRMVAAFLDEYLEVKNDSNAQFKTILS